MMIIQLKFFGFCFSQFFPFNSIQQQQQQQPYGWIFFSFNIHFSFFHFEHFFSHKNNNNFFFATSIQFDKVQRIFSNFEKEMLNSFFMSFNIHRTTTTRRKILAGPKFFINFSVNSII